MTPSSQTPIQRVGRAAIGLGAAAAAGVGSAGLTLEAAGLSETIKAVAQLGIPTAIAVFAGWWFLTSYLPQQRADADRRVDDERRAAQEREAMLRDELATARKAAEVAAAAAERREERLVSTFEAAVSGLQDGLHEVRGEVRALGARITGEQPQPQRSPATATRRRWPDPHPHDEAAPRAVPHAPTAPERVQPSPYSDSLRPRGSE